MRALPASRPLDPDPPQLRRAIARLELGSVARVTLIFRERFWAEHDTRLQRLAFLHTPHTPFNVWWTAYPLLAPVMVGWSGGPPARALAGDDITLAAVRTLADELGISRRRMSALLDASYTHDWDADPCARGAYSYVAVGGSGAARQVLRILG